MPKKLPYEDMDWAGMAGEYAKQPREPYQPKSDERKYWAGIVSGSAEKIISGIKEGTEKRKRRKYEQQKEERQTAEKRTIQQMANVWKKVGLGFKLSPEEAGSIGTTPEEAAAVVEKPEKRPKEYIVGSGFDVPTKTFHKIISREQPDGTFVTQDISHQVNYIPQNVIEAQRKRREGWTDTETKQYDQANKEIESRMKLMLDRRKNPIAARSRAVNEYLTQAGSRKLSDRVRQALLVAGFEPDVTPGIDPDANTIKKKYGITETYSGE